MKQKQDPNAGNIRVAIIPYEKNKNTTKDEKNFAVHRQSRFRG